MSNKAQKLVNKAIAAGKAKDLKNAELYYKQALRLVPKQPQILFNLSFLLAEQKRIKEIYPLITECIKSGKDIPNSYALLGSYYIDYEADLSKAESCFLKELEINPSSKKIYGLLAGLYFAEGKIDSAIEFQKKQLEVLPTRIQYDILLMQMHYSSKVSRDELLHFARRFYRDIFPNASLKTSLDDFAHLDLNENKSKFRIAFVSGDFKQHPIFYWLKDFIDLLADEEFEIYCYCNNEHDEVTKYWQERVTMFRDILGLDTESAAKLITEDKVDILIDLSGHTAANRLDIFVENPAFLQLTWLGQAGPIGLPQLDYMISDHDHVAVGEDHFYHEKVFRMPNFFAPVASRKFLEDFSVSNSSPAKENGFVTLGYFNSFKKLRDEVLELYASILSERPNTKIYLKSNIFVDEIKRQRFYQFFKDRGIAEERIIGERYYKYHDYMPCYNKVDIALDPFPVGGGTTTIDCLLMSTPLITLRGDRMSHRTASCFLKQAGLDELIAYDEDDYKAKVLGLIDDIERIDAYKKSIRNKFTNSSLVDIDCFTRDFKQALKTMYRTKLKDFVR